MKQIQIMLASVSLALLSLLTGSCPQNASQYSSNPATTFTGSTPGGDFIRSVLKIPAETKCDFIKWTFSLEDKNPRKFKLSALYGEGQPNTPGFWGGGTKIEAEGNYIVINDMNKVIYQLSSDKLAAPLFLIKINDNLLHFTFPDKQLLVGNSGWSYTLNRKDPLNNPYSEFRSQTISSSAAETDTAIRIVFEGRTPCRAIAKELNVNVGNECTKIKWQIVLYRDPVTLTPVSFKIGRIFVPVNNTHRQDSVTGRWSAVQGTKTNPDAVIYKLDIDKLQATLLLLKVDNNHLLFMDKDKNLLTGNSEFSYTLSRAPKK
jgi:hypothetical protein